MAATKIIGSFDLSILGGGIVGLAIARQVAIAHPKLKICVIEKEAELATHQSMRNSGVVHCGLYYKEGSLKSKLCTRGASLMKQYCREKQLPYIQCGKLIVANREDELQPLDDLFKNAISNGIPDIIKIKPRLIQKYQPGCTNALEAIWSPNTAIVDWRKVALSYAEDFKQLGGKIITEFTAIDFKHEDHKILIKKFDKSRQITNFVQTKSIVNTTGVWSDLFALKTGNNPNIRVVPFRGEYRYLGDRLASTIKTNIYPVPNPRVPFLGVHITPTVDGRVLVGPTALLVLGYESYRGQEKFNPFQIYNIIFKSGILRMFRKSDYFRAGLKELYKYLSPDELTREVKQLLPDVQTDDLIESKFSGIRAQMVTNHGDLVDDFIMEPGMMPEFRKILHLRNCPSPAATSSLAIAERILSSLEDRYL